MVKIDHIPERLAHLPLDERGFPIPYFIPIVHGKPEFRFADSKKKIHCRNYKKCWICGKRLLAGKFWFITGPKGLKNRTVSDEAMHEECARFSLKVCPHMFYEKAERRTTETDIPLLYAPSQALEKPKLFFLVEADKIYFYDELHTRFRAKKAESYHYVDNKLEFLLEGEI
jgi:hypothetical protein